METAFISICWTCVKLILAVSRTSVFYCVVCLIFHLLTFAIMTKEINFIMDSTGQWRKFAVFLFIFLVFNTTSSHEHSSGSRVNVSSKTQFANIVLGQHMFHSWDYTPIDPQHDTLNLHTDNRWQTGVDSSKTVYSFEVKEDTAPGTIVGKVETVFDTLTPITYSVQEDDGENLFLLSPHSGEFLLSRSLDFETQSFYILSVVVQQGHSQVSSVRVYFNVLDVNDNPPVFSQSTFSMSLLEDTPVGTCFLSLNVSDKDDGDSGDIKLTVVGGDEEEVFFINPTGSLCLNRELDRERQPFYNLTVTANDCVHPVSSQFTSTAHLVVVIDDVNDNAPLFVSARLVSIPEDTALHSVIMTVYALDDDSGSNSDVLYHLNDTSGGVFSIDNKSGTIYLDKTLDREQEDTLMITIIATDEGSPRMTTTLNLTVHIEDVNDHDPEFSQNVYSLTVREDIYRGRSLLQVQAFDRDIGTNGQVRYLLTQMSPFVVDTVRGVISAMDKLDREKDASYNLTVTAVDLGNTPRSATATVSVTVLDVNDFAPIFIPDTLSIHVLENEEDPSQLTHQVSALDEDSGINSKLQYFIQKGNSDGLFSITPSGTFQIFQGLDREVESVYFLTIIVVDSGLPRLTGTQTIHVIVDDINDNCPEFSEETYNTIVSENSPSGTVFAMITATDIDEGVNGKMRYSIENLDMPFAIDETTGELFTTAVLDRETVAIYRLMVIASDKHPTQPLSNSVLVTVLIGDVNDHWPQFMNSPYVAYVPTEMAPGSVVCAVTASDGDTEMNAELRYSLYGQSSELFSIYPDSGTVFTSSALRRTKDIVLNVYVEDAGENPKSDITTISIRFQNISEFPEMNVDVLSYSLSEDEPVGTLVAVVSAASIRAQPVSFYLASGNSEDMFHVDQLTGALTMENPLDYENIKEYTLLIEARDSGSPPFSSFEEIHINVSDVNDNHPQFTQTEYRCEVFENFPPSRVCNVLAIDTDSESNGLMQYNITEGNAYNLFIIDPVNGLLSTTASLDRENVPEFNLTVEAAELNNPLHKDRASVIVVILDRNDNAPCFSQIFVTEVSEDSPVGHTVIQVISTDDDTGANALVNYFITDQSNDMPFNIDFITGYITVKRPLDREAQDHYILKVNANDSAWLISTDVTVVITDVNDNRPVFSDHSYSTALPETKAKEVFLMQVFATDADVGQNSEILFVIEPSNEEFWVNASSGEIYTKQLLILHNSSFKIYQFTVIAFDCGSVPLYSNANVTLRIQPFNNYPPLFLPFQPLIAIPYNMAVGAEVFQFTAIDQDINNSSVGIKYVLNGGNASDFFWIQVDSGKVMLTQSTEDSIDLFLTLLVMAKDQGSPSLSSQTEVTFEITGRNQFPPSFREPNIAFSVPEDLVVGSVIGRIQAEDRDYGSNGAVMYCITPENQYLPFLVGEVSGLLTLIRELDFETEGIYHLNIKAMDGGWFSKTSMLNVTVVVMDVNDNPPVFLATEYITSVPENSEVGRNVLDVRATDRDSGANAQIFYALIAGQVEKFAIDSRNGSITTLDTFDYEREQVFDVTVKVTNIGVHTLFSVAHVVIHISDVNESTPTFRKKQYNFSIFKNVPVGTRVGKVTATDKDQGSEGQVFYLMFGHNKYMGFEISKLSGEIHTSRSLRKHGSSVIVLKVLAKNSGIITGMDVDETSVHISVIDMNDAPIFTSELYSAHVTEDSPVGTSVITVSALDQDSVMDWNGFVFSIEHGNTNLSFAVDPSSGVISVNSQLDRELLSVYNLTVKATDKGSPPATGTTAVIVIVDDVNDSVPKLSFTEVQVKENEPQGTIVAKLTASDFDLPPNQGPFTYWLVNPSIDSAFSLTPDGSLFTTQPIDRENISAYQVLVAVRDAGIPSLSSTTMIYIKILDENDNPSLPRNIFIEVKYFGSSFQGGMIGNICPEDQDESDTFNCAIKSGSHNMFSIANDTCELWSLPFQGEATFNITVEATDHLHLPVNSSVYVNYKGFTNASIDSCIFFYVSSPSMREFLSYKYVKFVKALDSLFNLQASKTHVFGIKHIDNEILLLAAVKNYNGQYLSREVASGISAGHKKLMEAQANVTISHITSDPCLTSPCQNGATCNKSIYISEDVAVLESPTVFFVSPRKQVFNCACPAGFTGTLCEDDIDECEVNPCENKGTCENNQGGFFCHCQSGFSGPLCSADVDECRKLKCQNGGTCIPTLDGYDCQCVPGFEGEMCEQFIDHCRSTPCVQGNCINSQSGFSCNCPFGVSGVHCEEHSYGFEELSFIEFPPLNHRTNLISLEFATVQRNSLLLYNDGGSSSTEFFALEILDGALHLSYDLGSGHVRLQTNKQVADGYFHTVTARRIGNMGSLHVDNCTENNGFCFSQSVGGSSERTLDVGSNMTFGGLRDFESIFLRPAQIKTHDFVGCIRNIHVNGILLRPLMALAAYNILDRCPRKTPSPCHSNPCRNGGMCHDHWSDYFCECKSPFTGKTCAEEMSEELVLRFNGNDYIEYVVKEQFKRDNLLKDLLDDEKEENTGDQTMINIKFKTKDSGVLMFVVGQREYTMLLINDGKPMYISKDTQSGLLSEFTVDSPVADGAWHVLLLSSNGQNTVLRLDNKIALNISERSMDLRPVRVAKIIFGAALMGYSKLQKPGFTGCVQYFNVTGYTLPISGHSVMVDVWPSSTLVQSSCNSPGVCFPLPCTEKYSCLSAHCQNRWRCGPAVQNGSCICLHNVSGLTCDICISAKESRDHCLESQGSMPLWLIAVILPLISVLVIIGIFIALYSVKQQNAKCPSNGSPHETEEGIYNKAFCFDHNGELTGPVSAEKVNDTRSDDQQRSSVEFHRLPTVSSNQPMPNSELDFYEISSISSAFHSDTASLHLSWHKQLSRTKHLKAEPKFWGDLSRTLLVGLKKECSSEKSAPKPKNVAKINAEQSQGTVCCHVRRVLQPEFPEPAQCLTFEEISKLNTPLEQTMSHHASGPVKSTTMINVLSNSDTDTTTTGAESESRVFSIINTRKCGHEHSSLHPTSPSPAGQHEAERAPSSMFEQWENIINMNVPFSSYVPVFEDIACLPSESSHNCSDIEETI